MIPLTLRPVADRFPGMISIPVPSRHRCALLTDSVASLRDTARRPELLEVLIAYDPDDPDTGAAARALGAEVAWQAPRRYGYAGSAHYWAALLEQARGWWCLPTWSDDAVMVTVGWDDLLHDCPPGTIAYTDGYPGLTCFPAVHMDALTALGRLCPLPAIDTWFEDIGRSAGVLVQPGISVRQDRPDINGRNNDQTHREGGGAWRAGGCGGMAYYTEPYHTWRQQDAARLRELHERG